MKLLLMNHFDESRTAVQGMFYGRFGIHLSCCKCRSFFSNLDCYTFGVLVAAGTSSFGLLIVGGKTLWNNHAWHIDSGLMLHSSIER